MAIDVIVSAGKIKFLKCVSLSERYDSQILGWEERGEWVLHHDQRDNNIPQLWPFSCGAMSKTE